MLFRITSRLMAALILLIIVADLNGQPAGQKNGSFRIVKYGELAKEVLKHRDKVVLVEFWATD